MACSGSVASTTPAVLIFTNLGIENLVEIINSNK
jgi:hypothetical protein